jgi:hypothetical protein
MDELVVIARYADLPRAEGAIAALKDAGVPAFLSVGSTIRLHVRAGESIRAEEVLEARGDIEAFDFSVVEPDPAPEPPPSHCARCEATALEPIRKLPIALFIAILFVGMIVVGSSSRGALVALLVMSWAAIYAFIGNWRCRECGYLWS